MKKLEAICPSGNWEQEVELVRPFATFSSKNSLMTGPGSTNQIYTAVNKYRVPSSPKLVNREHPDPNGLGPQNGDQRTLVDFVTVKIIPANITDHVKAKKKELQKLPYGGAFRFAMQFVVCDKDVSGMVVAPGGNTGNLQFFKPMCNGSVTSRTLDNAM